MPSAGLILIACGDEWSARALASVLEPAGYRVLRVASGPDVLARARSARPDLVLLTADPSDRNGVDVCRALREDPSLTPDLPVIGLSTAPVARALRLSWLRAGAWDCLGLPLDAEELLLKVDRYARATRDADRAREGTLVDQASGLYNGRGLKRRARELVAQAVRAHAALACVVFGPDPQSEAPGTQRGAAESSAVRAHVGWVLRTQARESDTIGWWSEDEFAVFAPGTDADGAEQLAQRLAYAIETAPPEPGATVPALAVHAGYVAVSDVHGTPVEPEGFVAQAEAALRLARVERGMPVRRFEPRP